MPLLQCKVSEETGCLIHFVFDTAHRGCLGSSRCFNYYCILPNCEKKTQIAFRTCTHIHKFAQQLNLRHLRKYSKILLLRNTDFQNLDVKMIHFNFSFNEGQIKLILLFMPRGNLCLCIQKAVEIQDFFGLPLYIS